MYMYITSGLARKGWVWVGSSHRHTNVNRYRHINMVHGQCGISNYVNRLIGPSANSLCLVHAKRVHVRDDMLCFDAASCLPMHGIDTGAGLSQLLDYRGATLSAGTLLLLSG